MKYLFSMVVGLSVFLSASLWAQAGNTGIWNINEFVDEFGDKTGNKFISTKNFIRGTFSNIVANNGDLRVVFIISRDSFGIQFYEDYFGMANDVPATLITINPATVSVRDKDGNTARLRGTTPGSSGQRLYVAPFSDIISVMKKGGLVRFSINIEGVNTYRFDIPDADYFDLAFSQIGGAAEEAPRQSGYRQMGAEDAWTVR